MGGISRLHYFLLIILGFIIILFGTALFQVFTAQVVEDLKMFAVDFKPKGGESSIEILSGGLEGTQITFSPIFPFAPAKYYLLQDVYLKFPCSIIKDREPDPVRARGYVVDELWGVFWVEASRCTEHAKYYGPFQYRKN